MPCSIPDVGGGWVSGFHYCTYCMHCAVKMSDISVYLELIPPHNHYKLDKELDYDNDNTDIDRDLIGISKYIIKWKENLRVLLGLTERDVHRINQVEAALRQ